MGRKRKPENQWMPPHVTIHKGRYIYRPYLDGRRSAEIVLGKVVATSKAKVWERWEEHQGVQTNITLAALLDGFNASPDFAALSPRTQRDYKRYYNIIINKPISAGVFGQTYADQITTPVIQGYLDKRAEEGAPQAGNKEVGYISSAYSWRIRRDERITRNPCIGVKKNPKGRRQHRPSASEYDTALSLASPEWVVLFMELDYLCRLRGNEALKLTRAAIEERGLRVSRGKGSKGGLVLWTPRLRDVVDRCLSLPLDVTPIDRSTLPLIHDRMGAPKTRAAVDSALRRLNRKMKAVGLKPFWFHDLKRAGISDFDGDKLKAGGHRDPKMLEIYDVSEDEVPATR